MTKSEIINILAEGTGLTKLETGAAIDGFIAIIQYALEKDEAVEIRGFGSFRVTTRKPRNARNPRTGEMIAIPEKRVPVFRPAADFKRYLNDKTS
ncbi:integration host factor subunit beta [candidate division KSB1 bacterium]|nr:integration host factor subunit beta [candidate division KSB1 bacterium]